MWEGGTYAIAWSPFGGYACCNFACMPPKWCSEWLSRHLALVLIGDNCNDFVWLKFGYHECDEVCCASISKSPFSANAAPIGSAAVQYPWSGLRKSDTFWSARLCSAAFLIVSSAYTAMQTSCNSIEASWGINSHMPPRICLTSILIWGVCSLRCSSPETVF